MRTVEAALEDASVATRRFKIMSWTRKVLKALGLSRRGCERTLMLIDSVQAPDAYQCANPELLCVASIFFVMKLEGEIGPGHGQFIRFVRKTVGLTLSAIQAQEYQLLELMPHDFCLWPTPSDLTLALMYALNFPLERIAELSLQAKLFAKSYTNKSGAFTIQALIVLPLIDSLVSPSFRSRRLLSLSRLFGSFGLDCGPLANEKRVRHFHLVAVK